MLHLDKEEASLEECLDSNFQDFGVGEVLNDDLAY